MFNDFPTESIILHKASGEAASKVEAIIDSKNVIIDNPSVIVEEDDFFERELPNGAKEYYRVVECVFYRKEHSIPNHYQIQVAKTNKADVERVLSTASQKNDARAPQKLFISHSSKDKEYIEAFVELLEDIGIPEGSIVCTSVPGYGIPGGVKLYDWLREQFTTCNLRVVFALSKNYYASAASLNEMGAAWVTKTTDTLMLLPGFGFKDIEGCIDPTTIGMKLDGDEEELKHRLNELKDTLLNEYSLQSITASRWERHRKTFIDKVRIIAKEHATKNLGIDSHDTQYILGNIVDTKMPDNVSVESAFLVVYAASVDGQIIKTNVMGSGTIINTAGKGFIKDSTPREIARWKRALNDLVAWRWVESIGKKGEIFEVTDLGYQMADVLRDRMDINTDNDPLIELGKFETP